MNIDKLLGMADESLRASRLLHQNDCFYSAVSRSYYAMFDAARAALLASGYDAESTKTHKGILVAFSQRLVKNGTLPKEMSQHLQRAEWIRNLSDYKGDVCDRAEVLELLERAQAFVEGVKAHISGLRAAGGADTP